MSINRVSGIVGSAVGTARFWDEADVPNLSAKRRFSTTADVRALSHRSPIKRSETSELDMIS
jgi:hypothetical protein